MENLKFRAWFKEAKRMVYSDKMSIAEFFNCVEDFDFLHTAIVMPFTGLLDKNKKEIYEGDILRAKGDFDSELFWEIEHKYNFKKFGRFEVVWNNDLGLWDLAFPRDIETDDYEIGEFGNYTCFENLGLFLDEFKTEVIGNAWENTELIINRTWVNKQGEKDE